MSADSTMSAELDETSEQSFDTRDTGSDESILDLIKTKDWLHTQMIQHEAALEAAKKTSPSSDDLEELAQSVMNLQVKLFEVSSSHHQKELVQERLKLGDALAKNLLAAHEAEEKLDGRGDEGDQGTTQQQQESLLPLVEKQIKLVSEVLKIYEEIKVKRDEVHQEKKECLEMQTRNRELMKNLQDHKNSQQQKGKDFGKNEKIQRSKAKLEELTSMIVIMRHMFQGLVLGSGIDWAKDEETRDLVLSLGKPLEF